MNLYTDGTTLATKVEAQQFIGELETVAKTANADDVQAHIDANAKLAGFAASADALDDTWVVLTAPTDAGPPLIYAGFVATLADPNSGYKAEQLDTYVVRVPAKRAKSHLDFIAALL